MVRSGECHPFFKAIGRQVRIAPSPDANPLPTGGSRSARNRIICCLLAMFSFSSITIGQQPGLSLELTASTTTPYVGQLVEVMLRVKGRPTGVTEVVIPWLTESPRRWTWQMPLGQWVEQQARPQAAALAVRWQGKVLEMPELASGVHGWRWGIIVQDVTNEEELPLRFAPVQVGAVRSTPLVLEVRRPPVVASSPGVWNLGVGDYTVKAEWQHPRAVLGQEAQLVITAMGKGDLEHLPSPNLAALPGWDGMLIERLPDGPRVPGAARVLRYTVRPRRLGTLSPPALIVRWFDPDTEAVQTLQVKIPPLDVGSAQEATPNVKPGRALDADDARAALPRDWDRAVESYEHLRRPFDPVWWSGLVLWLPVLGATAVIGLMGLQRVRPAWWVLARRRRGARAAARRFLQAGDALTSLRAREILADTVATLLEGTFHPELEALQAGLRRAELADALQPLLSAIQMWEFGPSYPNQVEAVRELAVLLLRQTAEVA